MNDLQVLGIDADYTRDDLKKAFRLKSKQFHPDKNDDSLNSHLIMIRVNQAYSNLLEKAKDPPVAAEPGDKDEAYTVYKDGIKKFQDIHPSKWKQLNKDGLFNAGAIETDAEAPVIIKSLIDKMAEVYLSFSVIVNEYPQSCWYADSYLKLKEIEKMTIRYVKILKSYESEKGRSK